MGRRSEYVYTDPDDIAWLEELVLRLPSNARVTLECKDGSRCTGTVSERPMAQMFRDPDENEGLNAILRLEEDAAPERERHVWLDRISFVHKLDSISGRVED